MTNLKSGVGTKHTDAMLGWRRPAMLWIAATILIIALLAPAGLFTVDEYFYTRMAEAFSNEGAFSFIQMRADTPAVSMSFAFPAGNGRLMPQYPVGYSIVAAPFFAVAGVKGLILLNAISTLATLFFTYGVARRIGGDKATGLTAVVIFVLCTFSLVYSFAVWPHMLATAISTGIVYFSISSEKTRSFFFIGASIGAACTIRIDAIVLAPAILFWLRFAEIESSRRKFLACGVGVCVGLAAASALSYAKAGVLNPFTYQNTLEQNDPANFIGAGFFLAASLLAVFTFDLRRAAQRISIGAGGVIALALLIAAMASKEVRMLFGGLWTFIVDQQAFALADQTPGVTRDEYGFLVFFGVAKKALLQSMPFIAVLALSFGRVFSVRAEDRRAILLLIASFGYFGLYALNQTDAGLSFNQRFLTPVLPFLAALAALEFCRIFASSRITKKSATYAAVAGFVLMALLLTTTLGKSPSSVWVEYYIPLLVAIATLITGFLALRSSFSGDAAANATRILLFSFGVSAAISGFDLGRTLVFRGISAAEEARLSALAEKDCLVLTDRLTVWGKRAGKDLSIVYWPILEITEVSRIASDFIDAGRCVYVHGQIPPDWASESFRLAPVAGSEGLASGPFSILRTGPEK